MASLHDFSTSSLSGEPVALADFAGKAVLVVNVASACGLTPHYAGLEALQQRYADQGFSVIGFPCNQFGGQEPGSPEAIATFCSTTYGVTFPLMAKTDVNGDARHPLFAWLCGEASGPEGKGDIRWNFTKFVVGRDGALVARFGPTTTPEDPALVAAIERALS
ncbi:MAG: glutathione peroxidase [Sandaracinaceae bacterium]|jgi:glutathione peroxidase|nr:glutathione peroxidase [Sandaracinaceae bacterium]MBK7152949.1 glutathione peroxidase [Sandaracinaceae bacterium]MBK7773608.1 glutathione peroxidase [Sandaracinaceae bacterium]MBK8411084.1 glutathione peroxidase [Sandaracinaceae bacterium]MBK8588920.1 glutathione peroxidase [Sandaracinaceae bacterium]